MKFVLWSPTDNSPALSRELYWPLQWRHNGHGGASSHQPRDCLLNRLFRRRCKKTSKLRVTGLCAGNSPVTGEFPAQRASNAEIFPFNDVIMIEIEQTTTPGVNRWRCCYLTHMWVTKLEWVNNKTYSLAWFASLFPHGKWHKIFRAICVQPWTNE